MVHMASVWVPFTSESKEAIASYPEIQKEMRLGLQTAGRKLGMYLNRRLRVKQQSDRREIFLRYLKEVAGAVSEINGAEANALYEELLKVAKKVTADADMKMDDRGRKVSPEEIELAKDASVLIVDPLNAAAALNRSAVVEEVPPAEESSPAKEESRKDAKAQKKAREFEMKLPQMNLVAIRAKDLDRAKDFYERIGLHFQRHAHGNVRSIWHVNCRHSSLKYTHLSKANRRPNPLVSASQ